MNLQGMEYIITRSYYRKESAASGIKGTPKGSKVPPRDQRQHAQFVE